MTDRLSPWPSDLGGIDTGGSFDGPRVLAARRGAASGAHAPRAFRTVLVHTWYDIVGVSVLLAPNDDAIGWRALSESWLSAVGRDPAPAPGVVGSALLLLGEVSDALAAAPNFTTITSRLSPYLPDIPVSSRWADTPPRRAGLHDEVLIWDLPQEGGDLPAPHRRLLAVTPHSGAGELSRWVWQGDVPGAPPALRYLIQSARLRHQYSIFRRDLPEVHRLGDRVDAACDRLISLLPPVGTPGGGDGRLAEAEDELVRLRTGESGTLHALARVRTMQATFGAAEHSLASDLSGGGLTSADLDMARHAREQLRVVETSLASSAERATEVSRRTSEIIERAQRERRDRLSLLQTSILGAMIMALTAAQSLQYKVDLPGPVRPAVIAALAAAALVLPALLLPRPEGAALRARGRLTDSAFFAAAGAAGGWLAAAAVAAALDRHAPVPVTIAVACCMAPVAVGLRSLGLWEHRK